MIFKSKAKEVEQISVEEIHCDAIYAQNIAQDGLDLIEECAALTTSAVLGSIPSVRGDGYGLVFKEPLGVILRYCAVERTDHSGITSCYSSYCC